MTEGKRSEIKLFDGRNLDMIVQPKLLSGELLDIVVSHFGLHEKDYFGIWFLDNMNQKRWLRYEKKVLDHNFERSSSPISMTFGVRFYVPSITYLKEARTIEIFYLQAVQSIFQGDLECDGKTAFLLAAYVMQEKNGDYVSDSITKSDLKNLNVLPENSLTVHRSMDECVEKISVHYKRMSGLPRGDAIVNYLSIVERLAMYGTQFFVAKEKLEESVKLGISHRGVGQHDLRDFNPSKELYTWNRIENLFYRDKKFSLEIRNLSRSGSSHSVNSLGRYGTIKKRPGERIDVITWHAPSSSDCREMWSLSVGYHQLYIKNRDLQREEIPRTLKNIARELTQSSSSLTLSLESEISLSSSSEHTEDACLQIITALNLRKQILEELLLERENQLKNLSQQENELTEILQSNKESDTSIGATFKFSEDSLHVFDCEAEIDNLQRDFRIQSQIMIAAKRLSVDKTVSRKIRKERKLLYKNAVSKLKVMENKLNIMRKNDLNNTDSMQEKPCTTDLDYSMSAVSSDLDPESSPDVNILRDSWPTSTDKRNNFSKQSLPRTYSNNRSVPQSAYPNHDNSADEVSSELYYTELQKRQASVGKYLLGEFGSHGVYSSVSNPSMKHLDTSGTMHASSSLTMISNSYSNNDQSSYGSSVFGDSNNDDESDGYESTSTKMGRLRTVQADQPTGFARRLNNYGRTFEDSSEQRVVMSKSVTPKNAYENNFSSMLSNAAWSQLAQPSLARLALDIASYPDEESRLLEQLANEDRASIHDDCFPESTGREDTTVTAGTLV